MAKQQKISLKIRKDLSRLQRKAVALEVIDYIVERSRKGRDKNENKFKAYSPSYEKSLDYLIAGKKGKPVNLTLSSEMLNSIKLLNDKPGEITIGFEKGDDENNGKAEGNILGTYGQDKPIRGKKRDFLGIQRAKLREIQDLYDVKVSKDKALERLNTIMEFLDDNREADWKYY